VHRPPQHAPSPLQFPPSETHADALHAPATQLNVQQSGPELQAEPAGWQTETVVQKCVVPSQVPEQQSAESVHAVPAPRQPGEPPPPPVPGVLPVPDDPPLPDEAPVDVPPVETELSPAEPPAPELPPLPGTAPESPELPHATPTSGAAMPAPNTNHQAFARRRNPCMLAIRRY